MNYDEMTIESLANDCFEESGYRINKADLENRIQHLCDKYHQEKLNNLSQHIVSKSFYCTDVNGRCDKQCSHCKEIDKD
jgi:hypothetical protein